MSGTEFSPIVKSTVLCAGVGLPAGLLKYLELLLLLLTLRFIVLVVDLVVLVVASTGTRSSKSKSSKSVSSKANEFALIEGLELALLVFVEVVLA